MSELDDLRALVSSYRAGARAAQEEADRYKQALEFITRECEAMNKGPTAVMIAREALGLSTQSTQPTSDDPELRELEKLDWKPTSDDTTGIRRAIERVKFNRILEIGSKRYPTSVQGVCDYLLAILDDATGDSSKGATNDAK